MIYNDNLDENMFTRGSSKVLKILKEIAIGTDAEIWIKGIIIFRKEMQ